MTAKIIKGALLSLVSLLAGFAAISLPFGLFTTLSSSAMHLVFVGEICIYFALAMTFLVFSEKKKMQRKKAAQRHQQRREKIQKVYADWYDVAA